MDVDATHPKLKICRLSLAKALGEGYGNEATDTLATVYHFPIGQPDPPAWVVMPSLVSDYLEKIVNRTTFCTHIANWTLLAVLGRPGDEDAWELHERWASSLRAVLRTAVADERWGRRDEAPRVESFGSPQNVTYGKTALLGAFVEISAEIHLEERNT